MRGPTYKVLVEVNGVKTHALLDQGAQVSLARKELLPLIKEKNKWSVNQCDTRNLKMSGQPIGAGGEALGAMAMVALDIVVEETKESRQVPCYVLESSKPIWSGELEDCAVVLGTNTLEGLGFNIVPQNGTVVKSVGQTDDITGQKNATAEVLTISLRHGICIGPQQVVLVDVRASHKSTFEMSEHIQ